LGHGHAPLTVEISSKVWAGVMTRLSVKNMQMQRAVGDWYFLINHALAVKKTT